MWRIAAMTVVCTLASACTPQLFPPDTLKDVDPKFDFSRWRMAPTSMENHKVQLGGRIVYSHTKDQTVRIVAAQLPIVEHPAYGPKETGKSHARLFAILYQGTLDPLFLQPGNRLIVVGYTRTQIQVEVEDVLRNLPAMTAECLHIWQTGDHDIADFHASGAGYVVLKEETYCGEEMPWSALGNF
jgi:starvation-inducible outer membrane lipoprotein